MLRRLSALAAAGVALPARVVRADDAPTDPPPDDGGQGSQATPAAADPAMTPLEAQVLALVNGARTARGLPALAWDATMAAVAREHARDMMSRGFVSHTGSDGSTPQQRLRRAGVQFRFGSENVWTYWGNDPALGPATMHAAMMKETYSPGVWNHIGNILYTGYARIGVGIAVATAGTQYLSETFAD
jgi:uncharacterized protein YkwD